MHLVAPERVSPRLAEALCVVALENSRHHVCADLFGMVSVCNLGFCGGHQSSGLDFLRAVHCPLDFSRLQNDRRFPRGRFFQTVDGKRFPPIWLGEGTTWIVKITGILPERTLLDAICTHHEHLVRRTILRRNEATQAWIEGFVRSTTRDAVMNLLDKRGFLAELRERLPPHELIGRDETLDLDYWKLAAQNESLINDQSDIDIDDAYSLAVFTQIMSESILAALRGG